MTCNAQCPKGGHTLGHAGHKKSPRVNGEEEGGECTDTASIVVFARRRASGKLSS
jgi:hypothetical protein